jgi:hypothetical protein
MSIQFKTLTFHGRPEEQLQERFRLKKSVTLLPVVIGALGCPLGPYPESDLDIDIYSGSIPITIIDESGHQMDFNRLNKSVIFLPSCFFSYVTTPQFLP